MRTGRTAPGLLTVLALLVSPSASGAVSTVANLTRLPTYPNLDRVAMDPVLHTEDFGRWCARFTAISADSLETVAIWYRQKLPSASETDLQQDPQFTRERPLIGIKLSIGRDYVAAYRLSDKRTRIELHRCSWSG
jgi:hypothetical protein